MKVACGRMTGSNKGSRSAERNRGLAAKSNVVFQTGIIMYRV